MKKIFTAYYCKRAALFAVCVILAVWLMPRKGANTYLYEMGKPWTYTLLTAPVDMPIYLDSLSARHVRDSLDRDFRPVYRRDINIERQAVAAYATRINATDGLELGPLERNVLIGALRKLLEDGIVDQATFQQVRSGALPQVRFIHDNTSMVVPTDDYLSARAAYSRLDSTYSDPAYRKAIVTTGMSQFLVPNIVPDSAATRRLYEDALQKAMAPRGVKQQGEKIIDKGDIVTPEIYSLLQAYERIQGARAKRQVDAHHYQVAGEVLYVTLIFAALFMFLKFFRPVLWGDMRSLLFITSIIMVFLLLAYAMSETLRHGIYIVPFTMVPILLVVFFDGRTAFFAFVVEILLASVVASYPQEFVYVQWLAGVTAICSIKDIDKRSQLVRAAAYILVSYVLAFVTFEVLQAGTADGINPRMFGIFTVNAVFISFAYVAVFVVEKVFGFVSSVTLVELSDVNSPLLRRLSEDSPGTFQHSMQVSNLASEAAHRIGANVQLVRTGALYHDIGKVNNPAFFTENQHGGVNPHDVLDPMQSARIVISHVTDGQKMAEKEKLPKAIRDFITQHHGRGRAAYFYNTYANAHPDQEIDPAPFTYPGPNPQTREASILMMADAVEAASRSLKDHTEESITQLVNKLIDGQIAAGLHNESPISFRDVSLIKQAFIERLRTMYHARVSYPDLKRRDDADTTDADVPTKSA